MEEKENVGTDQRGAIPILSLVNEGISLLGGLVTGVFGIFKAKAERKAAREKHEQEIETAETASEIKRREDKAAGDRAWEARGQEQSGWKDEFFLIILSAPIIGVFIPGLRPYIVDGFNALKECVPSWWLWMWSVCFGSAYGVKKFVNFMKTKKGD